MNGKHDSPQTTVSPGRLPTKVPLPQIQRHPAYYEDPYKNSMLFSYRLQDRQDAMLKRIVCV